MDVAAAKTLLFGPNPTPDDQVIFDVLDKLYAAGVEEGKYAEMMAGTDDA